MFNNGHLVGYMKNSGIMLPPPILEYTFNAEDFADTSGNGYTGTGYNTPTFVEGKGGPGTFAVNLNGTNQWFSMPANAAWEELSGKAFSFSIWVRIPSKNWAANSTGLISNWEQITSVPAKYWAISFVSNTTKPQFQNKNSVAETISSPTTVDIASTSYQSIMMNSENGVYDLYINDSLAATGSFATDAAVDSGRLVGIGGYYARYMAMRCDSVRFYDQLLTTDDRTALYENT